MRKCLGTLVILLLAGCASQPRNIASTYVSPLAYRDYTPEQVSGELQRVNQRLSELEGTLKKKADGDALKTAAGIALFWPTLFFLDGDGAQAQEYARLKGERDALEKVAIEKRCGTTPVQQASANSAPAAASYR